ncbi:MAG: BNR repeat-containing protein [Actinomycetota bacterium]|nr:BNR repeat-containing protein [Actinomycetota bacterium]
MAETDEQRAAARRTGAAPEDGPPQGGPPQDAPGTAARLDERLARIAAADAARPSAERELGAGGWSYFGDPRAISHDGDTFTGWISTTGNVWVARLTRGRRLRKRLIFRGLGRDDHNNPSLVFWHDGRIVVFFSPHSGHDLPPPGIPSVMRYRISQRPFSIDSFGPVHTVPTNAPGGLGYTYPNPIVQRSKLWLFWRGGGWNPTFSYTENLLDWVPARELMRHGGGERPYTKYVGDGDRQIHGIFTDGHPMAFKNSLYYLRYENERLFAASGRRLGTLASVPLHTSELDRVYRYTDEGGRAWTHDIALDADGKPIILYTRRVGRRDTFYYAHFDGRRWVSRKIVAGGPGRPSFTSGGGTLDHEDPRIVYLSRRTGAWHQVEVWITQDRGRTWTSRQLTSDPDGYSIRPVSPRGLTDFDRVLFSRGDERTIGFTNYRTRIHALDF